MNKMVTLIGVNHKHRQLIREIGSVWIVVRAQQSVPCFFDEPGILIKDQFNKGESRWVKPHEVSHNLTHEDFE